jgi:nitroreductase
MNVSDAIKARHSVRQFLDKSVSKVQISSLLDTARHAPSGANTQPWQVSILTGEAKISLAQKMMNAFEQGHTETADYEYYPTAWQEPYLGRRRACGLQLYQSLDIQRGDKQGQKAQWAANYRAFDAPVMMLFWMEDIMQTGSFLDFGMFLQSLMLAAVDSGLATCPQAALAEYPALVKSELGIPENAILLCGMALGYEDKGAAVNEYRTAREAVDSFTRFYD